MTRLVNLVSEYIYPIIGQSKFTDIDLFNNPNITFDECCKLNKFSKGLLAHHQNVTLQFFVILINSH